MDICLSVDLSWMYAVVFLYLSRMYALVIPSSIMNVFHNVSSIYDGCKPQCFHDLSWMYALAFPSSIMDICLSVFLIYHGMMYTIIMVFLWSKIDIRQSVSLIYHGCML